MRLPEPLVRGTLLKRYKRFLADVRLEDGGEVTAHCANPGRMIGCAEPGSQVVLSVSDRPGRKLTHSLELVRSGRTWVGVNTARANGLVREALESGELAELPEHDRLQPEPRIADGSRADFLLTGRHGRTWLEVKTTTLARGSVAQFPDAVTARGLRHLRELAGRARSGDGAALLLVVNRGDCRRFRPAWDVDPAWCSGLLEAVEAGVRPVARSVRIRIPTLRLGRAMPIDLTPPAGAA